MDRIVTCVYCGKEYPNNTPTHGTEILTSHIEECEKHPLYEARKEISFLYTLLANVILKYHVKDIGHKNNFHYLDVDGDLRGQIEFLYSVSKD